MKFCNPLLAAALALLAPQVTSASLLIGYNSFSGNTDNSPNVPTSGLSASMVSTGFSTSGNGSTDGYYGPDGVSGVAVGSTATNGRVNASGAQLTITNGTLNSTYSLSSLLFDLTVGNNSNNSFTNLTYEKNGEGAVSLLGSGAVSGATASNPVTPISSPYSVVLNTTNYSDFVANLVGITLSAGDQIVFKWTAGSNVRLDNVALIGELSPIPEPGSLLALGGLIGAGCLLRSRRRPLVTPGAV